MNQWILWRRIDLHGHEACRLYELGAQWHLEGTAVFSSDNRACALSYLIACDSSWNTVRGVISGWLGSDSVNIELVVDPIDHRWQLNGVEKLSVSGCIDLDLNFSPSTNLLPIRRLNLDIGQQAEVEAAWLRFPSFELERFSQVYTRLDEFTYRYASGGGKFVRDLTVNKVGLVTDYPGLWQAEQ